MIETTVLITKKKKTIELLKQMKQKIVLKTDLEKKTRQIKEESFLQNDMASIFIHHQLLQKSLIQIGQVKKTIDFSQKNICIKLNKNKIEIIQNSKK